MEVTALCFTLVTTVMILLCDHDQTVDAVSLRIDPNRLQFFEYKSLTFYCEGDFYYEVKHRSAMETSTCKNTTPTPSVCTITNVFPEDSGEYWCEAEDGERSKSVNIIVTGGSVILESPARPVMEGDDVTLLCTNKTNSYNLPADFYKDGHMIGSSSTGEMIITSVSRFDEGLYKCSISGGGESAESWLTVREALRETSPFSLEHISLMIVIVFLLSVVLALGFILVSKCSSNRGRPGRDSSEQRNDLVGSLPVCEAEEASGPDANTTTAAETKEEEETAIESDDGQRLVPTDKTEAPSTSIYYTLGHMDTPQPASNITADSTVSATYSPSTEDLYSTVKKQVTAEEAAPEERACADTCTSLLSESNLGKHFEANATEVMTNVVYGHVAFV